MFNKNTYTRYGAFIRKRRNILNLTQADLAKKLNCSPQAVFSYEDNRIEINLSMVGDLCKILKISVNDFIKKKNTKPDDVIDSTFNNQKFVKNLIDLRKNRELSQKDVASHINVSFQRVSKWETGTSHPTIKEFVDLAKFYGLDLDEFYFSKVSYVEYKYEKKKYGFLANKKIMVPVLSLLAVAIITGTITPIIVSSTSRKNNRPDIIIPSTSSSASSQDLGEDNILPSGYHEVKIIYYYKTTLVRDVDILHVKNNEMIDFPLFIHEGYTLNGYKLKDQSYFDITSKVNRNLTLYADLTIKHFTVNFYSYSYHLLKRDDVEYLGSATAPSEHELQVKDSVFIGWDKEFNCIKENLDIYPLYEEQEYKINLSLNGDEGAKFSDGTTYKVIENYKRSQLNTLPTPIKKDYKFNGWTYNGEFITPDTEIFDNITFQPSFVYAGKTFNITFTNTNNIYVEPITIEYKEIIYSLPTLTFENKYCNKYLLNGEKFTLPYTHNVKKDLELECVWENQVSIYSYDVLSDHKSIKLKKIKNIQETVVIPESINGYFVKELAKDVLDPNSVVKTIEVKANLNLIEEEAFINCKNLEIFLLHESKGGLRVGNNIFKGLNIRILKIPNLKKLDGISNFFYKDFGINKDAAVRITFNKYAAGFEMFDDESSNIISLGFEKNLIKDRYELESTNFLKCTGLKELYLTEGLGFIDFDRFPHLEMENLLIPSTCTGARGTVSHHIGTFKVKKNPHNSFALYFKMLDVDIVDFSDLDYLQVIYPEEFTLGINKEYHAAKFINSGRMEILSGTDKFIDGKNNHIKVYFYDTDEVPYCYTSFEWIQNYQSVDINFIQ